MRWVLAIAACCTFVGESHAVTHYNVRLNTSARLGQVALLTFDLTSCVPTPDSLEILIFGHDGKTRPLASPGRSYFEGGPVRGHLLTNVNPAQRTVVGNDFFYNSLSVPFDSLGTIVRFSVQLPEPASVGPRFPDELAFFYLTDSSMTAFNTGDPLGANALFAISVTGASGGDLGIFAPMMFVAPDSLILDLYGVGVSPPRSARGLLRFRSVAPNPSAGGVLLVYEVPEPAVSCA